MSLRNVMLLIRDVPRTVNFYSVLGLNVQHQADELAVMQTTNNVKITLKKVEGEANLCTGYSPLLNFDVMDLDTLLPSLLQMGATLDGPIKYPQFGKVAAIRSPDGHMIGLYEPAR